MFNPLNELFINLGTDLDEDPSTIFPSLFAGSNSWGDYDNDGDPDLIILGQTADPNSSVSRLYQNDPIGRLTEVTTASAIKGLKPNKDSSMFISSSLLISGYPFLVL